MVSLTAETEEKFFDQLISN